VPLWLGTDLDPEPLSIWMLLAFASGGLIGLVLGLLTRPGRRTSK
jgi:hypothetical protein